jgi:hypothetical protein
VDTPSTEAAQERSAASTAARSSPPPLGAGMPCVLANIGVMVSVMNRSSLSSASSCGRAIFLFSSFLFARQLWEERSQNRKHTRDADDPRGAMDAAAAYTIRPNFKNKFRPAVVKELLHEVLVRKLANLSYDAETTPKLTKEIADEAKTLLKAQQNLERYKFVVQVVMGEQRGEGVKMACRCFWDSDTDGLASVTYTNDSLFCVATAYGVYYY